MAQVFRNQQGTLVSIQVLRAIAALAVTIEHIAGYEFVRQYKLPDALPHFNFGRAGVDLFFVISGFVMVYSSGAYFGRVGGPQEFFLRRLARIAPLYWVTTSIILVYLLLQYRGLAAVNFSPAAVVASYLFIPYPQTDGFMAPVHGVGWTLNYEMFFYACFCGAVLFTRRTGVLVISIALVILVAMNQVASLPNPFGYWADPIILEFVLGMLIALLYQAGYRVPRRWAGGIVAIGALALVASDHWQHVSRLIVLGVPAAFIVAALVMADHRASEGPVWRMASFLGDASYSLYLVHPLAITLPRRFFPGLLDPAHWPWLYAGMLMVVAVSAAIVVHLLFERPTTRFLQRQIVGMFRGAGHPASKAAPL
jgi:exopolysaccharide production protein ExoZ